MRLTLADLSNLPIRTAGIVLWNGLKVAENAEKFTCKVMQPGLISYNDSGNGVLLVTKEAIDRMSPGFVGKPVIDERHMDGLESKDFGRVADGVITNTFWNDEGWMCYDVLIWNPKTKEHMRSGDYGVSNAYRIKEFKGGGVHNAIPYDQEVVDGEPTHLAIVKSPRYNGAAILLNSLPTGGSMIKAWLKRINDAVKNAIDPQASEVEVDGKKVPLKMLIEAWEAEQAEHAAATPAPAADGSEELGPDSTVPVQGKDIKIQDMINSYKTKVAKNAAPPETDEEKAAREKKEADEKAALEAKNAEAAAAAEAKAKKDKEDAEALEKKNAEDKAAAEALEKKKKDEEVENARKKELELKNAQHFEALQSAAHQRGGTDVVAPKTSAVRQAEGRARYGSKVQRGA